MRALSPCGATDFDPPERGGEPSPSASAASNVASGADK